MYLCCIVLSIYFFPILSQNIVVLAVNHYFATAITELIAFIFKKWIL